MDAQLIEEQELLDGYECSDGSQVIIATTEELISAAGCDISAFAQGQVVEVLHEPGSGNIIVQANFTTRNALHNGGQLQIAELEEGGSLEPVATTSRNVRESDSDSNANKCSSCGIVFDSKRALKLHSTVHVDEAYYACEFCSESKIHWTEMWLHQCSNIESVPIVCPQCHKSLSSKKQLQVHEEVHELQRRFTSKPMKGYFNRKLQETEEAVVDWGAKPFICGVCGKPFARLYEVEYHEKLHTGERQPSNVCDRCGITYIGRHDLNKHMALGCTGELSRKTDAPFERRQFLTTDIYIPDDIQF